MADTQEQAAELWKKTHGDAPFPGEVPFIQWVMEQIAASTANEQREAADIDNDLRGDRELVNERNRESTALCEPVTVEEAREAAQSWFIHGVWRQQDEDQMRKILEQFRAGRAKGAGLG